MKLSARGADNYKDYAKIYDELKGDRSDKISLLLDVIAKYRPGARSVIELACGTGTILHGLTGIYDLTGLDISRHMLRQAQKRLPGTPLIHADMSDFALTQTFDVAYCFHNSVNHLLTFKKWEKFFARVAAHVNKDGLFIFDVNPIEKLESHVAAGPNTLQGEGYHVVTHITKHHQRPERYYWNVDIFRKRRGRKNSFVQKRTIVTIDAYPDEQIRAALQERFEILECFTLDKAEKAEKPDDIGRTYYICRKLPSITIGL